MRALAVAVVVLFVGLGLGLRVPNGVESLPEGEVREAARAALEAEVFIRHMNWPFDPITLAISVASIEHRPGSCYASDPALEPDERRRADYVVTVDMHTFFGVPFRSFEVTCNGRRIASVR